MRVTVIPVIIGALGAVTKDFVGGGTGRVGNRKSREHQNYSIVKIGQNSKKSPLKSDSTLLRAKETEHRIQFIVITRTLLGEGLTTLQGMLSVYSGMYFLLSMFYQNVYNLLVCSY